MKHVLLCLLYWNHIQLSASFPVEEKPGFTLWPLEKRDLTPVTELQYSGIRGIQLGISEKSHFGIPDPTCRGKLPGEGCLTMDHFAVDVSSQVLKPFISSTEWYRKCSMPESQRQTTVQYHVFSTPNIYQVQRRDQPISF
jgi:hypothetical protein